MSTNRNEVLVAQLRTPQEIRASTETARHHAQGRSVQARTKKVGLQFGIPPKPFLSSLFRRRH